MQKEKKMFVRYLLQFTKITGKYNKYYYGKTTTTSCYCNNSDHKFSLNKVVNYVPFIILRENSTKCTTTNVPVSTSLATGGGGSSDNNFDGAGVVARQLVVGKDDNNHNDMKMKKKIVYPFDKMPTAAIRLPIIGTKLEFMLCGAGKK